MLNKILRYLGVTIEDDVKFGQFEPFLSFPWNLLRVKRGVTTFAKVQLIPFEIQMKGDGYVNETVIGEESNLRNATTILPGKSTFS